MRRTGALLSGDVERPASACCLRREFDLAVVPGRAPARVTADSRYVLFVNGVEAARGPVRANPRRLRYDGLDLAPLLRRGRNVVAALVRFFGGPNPWWMPVPPALQLGAGAFLFEAELGAELLASDGRWKALPGAGLGELAGEGIGALPVEICDAAARPAGWAELGFDDERWSPAHELSAASIGFTGRHEPPSHPYGPLLPRPVPLLGCVPRAPRWVRNGGAVPAPAAEETPADPVERALADLAAAGGLEEVRLPLLLPEAGGAAHVVCVDFGEVVAGTVVLELEAPAGTRVDAAASEFAAPAGTRVDAAASEFADAAASATSRAARRTASRASLPTASAISPSASAGRAR